MDFKDQYRKYSLIGIILILGIIVFFELTPFLSGILGAMTIYVLLRGQMKYLTKERKMKKSVAAIILLSETILCFLIPMAIIVILLIGKVSNLSLDPQAIIDPIRHTINFIKEKTGYNFSDVDNLTSVAAFIPKAGQLLMNGISSLVINVLVLIFALYFMLTGSEPMERYVRDILPFNDKNKDDVSREMMMIVKSNAIGIPLVAIIQGIIAMIGYYIFGAPVPWLLALLTGFASVIPMVGTAFIWVPVVAYMAILGNWGAALGLTLYCALVVTQIDNLIRFILQKKMADTHPLITIFGVVIGLSLFGFMGVIFGPLLLSMFILCFNIFKREYIGNNND